MLMRLTFNVLTVPHSHLGGSSELISKVRVKASAALVKSIQRISSGADEPASIVNDCHSFVQSALSNGKHSGEGYLHYKDRPEIADHLKGIWHSTDPLRYPVSYSDKPSCFFQDALRGIEQCVLSTNYDATVEGLYHLPQCLPWRG